MFGFHDHIHDPRSGRPEPHGSWVSERLITWVIWVTGASCLALAVYAYAKGRDHILMTTTLVTAVYCIALAYFRGRAIARKMAALQAAVIEHDEQLAKVFRDTEAT